MSGRDYLRALAVVVVWGVNFAVIGKGLQDLPPLLFVALRYLFTAFPAILFVKRPGTRWYWVALIALFMNIGQFGLLFVGIERGAPAGLASLLLQSQAIFTLIFATAVIRELPRPAQLAGTVVASAGIAVLALGQASGGPLVPLLMVIGAGACWGAGNICMRLARARSPMGLIVWAALIPPIPLFLLSLWLEGSRADLTAVQHFWPVGFLALAYVVIAATLFGFGTWSSLLRRYPAAAVSPFSLLVPVVGILSAAIFLGERPSPVELLGGAIVLAGLALVTGVVRGALRAASRRLRPAA